MTNNPSKKSLENQTPPTLTDESQGKKLPPLPNPGEIHPAGDKKIFPALPKASDLDLPQLPPLPGHVPEEDVQQFSEGPTANTKFSHANDIFPDSMARPEQIDPTFPEEQQFVISLSGEQFRTLLDGVSFTFRSIAKSDGEIDSNESEATDVSWDKFMTLFEATDPAANEAFDLRIKDIIEGDSSYESFQNILDKTESDEAATNAIDNFLLKFRGVINQAPEQTQSKLKSLLIDGCIQIAKSSSDESAPQPISHVELQAILGFADILGVELTDKVRKQLTAHGQSSTEAVAEAMNTVSAREYTPPPIGSFSGNEEGGDSCETGSANPVEIDTDNIAHEPEQFFQRPELEKQFDSYQNKILALTNSELALLLNWDLIPLLVGAADRDLNDREIRAFIFNDLIPDAKKTKKDPIVQDYFDQKLEDKLSRLDNNLFPGPIDSILKHLETGHEHQAKQEINIILGDSLELWEKLGIESDDLAAIKKQLLGNCIEVALSDGDGLGRMISRAEAKMMAHISRKLDIQMDEDAQNIIKSSLEAIVPQEQDPKNKPASSYWNSLTNEECLNLFHTLFLIPSLVAKADRQFDLDELKAIEAAIHELEEILAGILLDEPDDDEWDEEESNKRMDVIGQNGNLGIHYSKSEVDGLNDMSIGRVEELQWDIEEMKKAIVDAADDYDKYVGG